jgi:hypothetical protein
MYAKDSSIILDRREAIRIKIKSLALESQVIRREERKLSRQERARNAFATANGHTNPQQFSNGNPLREELYRHRVDVVRYETRHAHLAYGFIRGLEYSQMEPKTHKSPNWERVRQLLKKYGPKNMVEPTTMSNPVMVIASAAKLPRVRSHKSYAEFIASRAEGHQEVVA